MPQFSRTDSGEFVVADEARRVFTIDTLAAISDEAEICLDRKANANLAFALFEEKFNHGMNKHMILSYKSDKTPS